MHPNPRKQFLVYLQWCDLGKEVLIGMDANKNVNDPNAKIAEIFDETDLIDLHYHRYPVQPKLATHQRGSHQLI